MIEKILQNKNDKIERKVRYLPCTIDRFNKYFPGIIKGDYLCFTGNTSSGKTTLMKKIAVFDAIEYAIEQNVDLKILYFGLEESEEQFDYSLLSYIMRKEYSLRYNIIDFNYINEGIAEDDIPKLIEIEPVLKRWKEYVIYYDHTYNPYGIYNHIREFAASRGKFYFKDKRVDDKSEGWDSYKPDNEEEFIIVIVDHISLLLAEKQHRNQLDEAMKDMSFYLRNYVSKKFGYTSIVVHQQFATTEDLEHIKSNRWLPTLMGLSDNKRIGRDYLTVIGIANPNRYKISSYEGYYQLREYDGFLRFITILKQRFGAVDKTLPIFFDGKSNWIKAAPKPDDKDGIEKMSNYIKSLI